MGATDFIILLPPSEGKADGGRESIPWSPASGAFGRLLGDSRMEVCERLAAVRGGDAKLLGVKGELLERSRRANASLLGSPSLPAWRRYTGVVWDHLDLESIPSSTRGAVLKRIVIPSGLAGVVRADDPLPDYRLKMGARLADLGVMSAWWRRDITTALARAARSKVIIDLLTIEHRAAFDWTSLPTAVRVDLVAKSGGVVGGHNAKAAKGRLARHLLTTKATDVARMVSSFKDAEYSATLDKGR